MRGNIMRTANKKFTVMPDSTCREAVGSGTPLSERGNYRQLRSLQFTHKGDSGTR